MMHGDSTLDDDEVDFFFQDVNGKGASSKSSSLPDLSSNDKDLSAAITAALSDDVEDNHIIGSTGKDDEAEEIMINFLAGDEIPDLNAIDEAMNLLTVKDEVEDTVKDSTNSKSSVGNDDATQASVASLSSIILATGDEEDGHDDNPSNTTTTTNEARTVPIQQFENALALIQDLEKQVDTLESIKHQLQFENAQLRQETDTQQKLIASYEKKLSEFPKLMEATVEEQSAVAAEMAKGVAKQSFWNEYMSRQEELSAQEKKNRRKTATTTSLKQSDFLKNVVERQEKERSSSAPSNFLQGWKSKFHSMGGGRGGSQVRTDGSGRNGEKSHLSSVNVYNGVGNKPTQRHEQDDTGIAADDAENPSREDVKMLSLLT
ncbi:hypothetical protein IV203_015582 [Nitzschia inconspicua]|uniref:Uncharacterized protein n=1 Tax=Nitzschia inconspicua TaxID=303405 RepID=A0A9K3PTL3_9STRA|nr:hypothetical protein IV203_015582 [Nitzschia inconspicua]